ncbi:hypothetical protein ACHAXS_006562 [Conticribra weissflogii]
MASVPQPPTLEEISSMSWRADPTDPPSVHRPVPPPPAHPAQSMSSPHRPHPQSQQLQQQPQLPQSSQPQPPPPMGYTRKNTRERRSWDAVTSLMMSEPSDMNFFGPPMTRAGSVGTSISTSSNSNSNSNSNGNGNGNGKGNHSFNKEDPPDSSEDGNKLLPRHLLSSKSIRQQGQTLPHSYHPQGGVAAPPPQKPKRKPSLTSTSQSFSSSMSDIWKPGPPPPRVGQHGGGGGGVGGGVIKFGSRGNPNGNPNGNGNAGGNDSNNNPGNNKINKSHGPTGHSPQTQMPGLEFRRYSSVGSGLPSSSQLVDAAKNPSPPSSAAVGSGSSSGVGVAFNNVAQSASVNTSGSGTNDQRPIKSSSFHVNGNMTSSTSSGGKKHDHNNNYSGTANNANSTTRNSHHKNTQTKRASSVSALGRSSRRLSPHPVRIFEEEDNKKIIAEAKAAIKATQKEKDRSFNKRRSSSESIGVNEKEGNGETARISSRKGSVDNDKKLSDANANSAIPTASTNNHVGNEAHPSRTNGSPTATAVPQSPKKQSQSQSQPQHFSTGPSLSSFFEQQSQQAHQQLVQQQKQQQPKQPQKHPPPKKKSLLEAMLEMKHPNKPQANHSAYPPDTDNTNSIGNPHNDPSTSGGYSTQSNSDKDEDDTDEDTVNSLVPFSSNMNQCYNTSDNGSINSTGTGIDNASHSSNFSHNSNFSNNVHNVHFQQPPLQQQQKSQQQTYISSSASVASFASNYTTNTSATSNTAATQTAEELRHLIEAMQVEFQRLRAAKLQAETKADKLETDLSMMQSEMEGEYLKLSMENEMLKSEGSQDHVALERALEKVKELEMENRGMKGKMGELERTLEGERERVKVLEEENEKLKKGLEVLVKGQQQQHGQQSYAQQDQLTHHHHHHDKDVERPEKSAKSDKDRERGKRKKKSSHKEGKPSRSSRKDRDKDKQGTSGRREKSLSKSMGNLYQEEDDQRNIHKTNLNENPLYFNPMLNSIGNPMICSLTSSIGNDSNSSHGNSIGNRLISQRRGSMPDKNGDATNTRYDTPPSPETPTPPLTPSPEFPEKKAVKRASAAEDETNPALGTSSSSSFGPLKNLQKYRNAMSISGGGGNNPSLSSFDNDNISPEESSGQEQQHHLNRYSTSQHQEQKQKLPLEQKFGNSHQISSSKSKFQRNLNRNSQREDVGASVRNILEKFNVLKEKSGAGRD